MPVETFLCVEVHEGEIVVTVKDEPTQRGPAEWTGALELQADRIAKTLLSGGESILTLDVDLKIERSPGTSPVRRYKRPTSSSGWHRI